MKKLDIAFSSVALAFLLALAVLAGRGRGVVSESENRYLADPPTARFLSAEYKKQFSAWLGDQVALRAQFLALRTAVDYHGFGIKSSLANGVQQGKDGFLFLAGGDSIQMGVGIHRVDGGTLGAIAAAQQKISDYYAAHGKQYVLVVHPEKSGVYPEKIYGNYAVTTSVCDDINAYLAAHTSVAAVDTKSPLVAEKARGQVYWKNDTHWTRRGDYTVYAAVLSALDAVLGRGDTPVPYTVQPGALDFGGDLRVMLGLGKGNERDDEYNIDARAVRLGAGDDFERAAGAYRAATGNESAGKVFVFENAGRQGSLLVYGDSQFLPENKPICAFLAEHFARVTYVWSYDLLEDVEAEVPHDVVIHAVAERFAERELVKVPAYMAGE